MKSFYWLDVILATIAAVLLFFMAKGNNALAISMPVFFIIIDLCRTRREIEKLHKEIKNIKKGLNLPLL